MAAKQSYFHGTGRRKTSVAQVKIMPGNGAIIINGVPYEELFPSLEHRRAILQPLLVTESLSKFNAMIKVNGGGVTGQSGAISLGIARALVESNESLKSILRQYGLLTRDPRVKERKKPGLRRARKAPQYTKR
ncbi:MAG: 30S ribosomal protein S9 [Dehalococcoidia bacterium]|jgi:small subunit ribosomal protein S9|nr:MAG: 30S ribosomal protein S9 [Dehalococcoidia bacterium]